MRALIAAGYPPHAILYTAGVAIVRQLLRDGHSPLYAGRDAWELEEELRRARAGLLLA